MTRNSVLGVVAAALASTAIPNIASAAGLPRPGGNRCYQPNGDREKARRLRQARRVAEREQASCRVCEGGGWVQVYSPKPPAFEECPSCFNVLRLPSP